MRVHRKNSQLKYFYEIEFLMCFILFKSKVQFKMTCETTISFVKCAATEYCLYMYSTHIPKGSLHSIFHIAFTYNIYVKNNVTTISNQPSIYSIVILHDQLSSSACIYLLFFFSSSFWFCFCTYTILLYMLNNSNHLLYCTMYWCTVSRFVLLWMSAVVRNRRVIRTWTLARAQIARTQTPRLCTLACAL